MCKRLTTYHLAIFSVLCTLSVLFSNIAFAGPTGPKGISYHIQDFKTEVLEDGLTVKITGNSPPAFTTRTLYDPTRFVMDIANVELDSTLSLETLVPSNKVVDLQTSVLKNQNPSITRFVFTLKGDFHPNVERKNNDLLVQFFTSKDVAESARPVEKIQASEGNQEAQSKPMAKDQTLDALIISSEELANRKKDGLDTPSDSQAAISAMQDNFEFSGYTKKRISVDFYKIDLHNVFRLFRQISDLNLIVDESVKGTLTLALEDVPWDFALDIILNLTDLAKEERYNTIVIYPKKKEFAWPERSMDNLSFEADLQIVEEEALIIQQAANQPKEIMLAKELQRKGRIAEKKGDFETAAEFYVKAFEQWPSNNKISNKLANLYLVNLGINAKAVFYAKQSLKIQPEDTAAALTAAIGLANMQRVPEAAEYFVQSIIGAPPMKEALLSYAAFNESNGKPSAALKIIDKFHSYYGETVDTMVAKARIYDTLALTEKADAQYKMILNSGFPLRTDLRRFIQARVMVEK